MGQLEGVNDRKQLTTYFGKRVAYVFKAQKSVKGSKFRVMWGRIARGHGNNGLAKAKFRHNLPPRAIGATLRVFLYPQRTHTIQNVENNNQMQAAGQQENKQGGGLNTIKELNKALGKKH